MESFREQRCRWCLGMFHICPCCDHGQVYCGPDCKKAGRDAQVREAKRKYLADEDVREGERERLRDYRARVPDHGSPKVAPDASVLIDATRAPMGGDGDRDGGNDHASQGSPVGLLQPEPGAPQQPAMPAPPPLVVPTVSSPSVDPVGSAPPMVPTGAVRPASTEVRCAFCGRRARFVRFGPLRRRRSPRWQIRGRDP
jgi:hypothetical protein